jgi:hypothetical protein
MPPKKPREAWLTVAQLEAKYVRLAVALNYGKHSSKNLTPDGLNSIDQGRFARAIAEQASGEGITRELMRDQIEKGAMRVTHQRALSTLCFGFPISDSKWRDASADDFMDWWTTWRHRANSPTSDVQLALVGIAREESYVCERLASIWITLNQSPPASPWPITGQMRCYPSPLPIEVAIKRAWLQLDGRGRCTFKYNVGSSDIPGEFGPVHFMWAGTSQRPTCDLRADQGYLGKVDFPDNFCEAHGLTPGTVVTARLAVFIKDLEPVVKGTRQKAETYSWHRPGHKTLGQATKDAILTRIEMLKHQKRSRNLQGAAEGWVVVCEASRELTEKAKEQILTIGFLP